MRPRRRAGKGATREGLKDDHAAAAAGASRPPVRGRGGAGLVRATAVRLRLRRGKPVPGRGALTFGTVPVAARVVGDADLATLRGSVANLLFTDRLQQSTESPRLENQALKKQATAPKRHLK